MFLSDLSFFTDLMPFIFQVKIFMVFLVMILRNREVFGVEWLIKKTKKG